MATEKRLIDAHEVEELFYKQVEYGATDLMDAFDDALEDAQTVDAVEAVRCRGCIRWYEPEETCLKIYSDGAVSAYAWQFRKPDDFCSYGERREA